ncbi:hypothetical protein B0J13DRAFT_526390 [Dactylonectria estremocensis]|uniref:Uncharacterized protein n=1 Tax=Dactylonectria estremocensis TaxID=1079267 RepID=A0A9P9J236_9HYPO|nr:hypothetical protein B0J13DRAFT_526390 [Dactylonectria estremocensis]
MADLVNAFDFKSPDYTIPNLPNASQPNTNSKGEYDGSSHCASRANNDTASLAEKGFKSVHGLLTEGRTLVLETPGQAVSVASSGYAVALTEATKKHDIVQQGWVLHAMEIGGNEFTVSSADNGLYICKNLKLCKDPNAATIFIVDFKPSKGHSFKDQKPGQYLAASRKKQLGWQKKQSFWRIFSVTY